MLLLAEDEAARVKVLEKNLGARSPRYPTAQHCLQIVACRQIAVSLAKKSNCSSHEYRCDRLYEASANFRIFRSKPRKHCSEAVVLAIERSSTYSAE
jgi:hypothetical protein